MGTSNESSELFSSSGKQSSGNTGDSSSTYFSGAGQSEPAVSLGDSPNSPTEHAPLENQPWRCPFGIRPWPCVAQDSASGQHNLTWPRQVVWKCEGRTLLAEPDRWHWLDGSQPDQHQPHQHQHPQRQPPGEGAVAEVQPASAIREARGTVGPEALSRPDAHNVVADTEPERDYTSPGPDIQNLLSELIDELGGSSSGSQSSPCVSAHLPGRKAASSSSESQSCLSVQDMELESPASEHDSYMCHSGHIASTEVSYFGISPHLAAPENMISISQSVVSPCQSFEDMECQSQGHRSLNSACQIVTTPERPSSLPGRYSLVPYSLSSSESPLLAPGDPSLDLKSFPVQQETGFTSLRDRERNEQSPAVSARLSPRVVLCRVDLCSRCVRPPTRVAPRRSARVAARTGSPPNYAPPRGETDSLSPETPFSPESSFNPERSFSPEISPQKRLRLRVSPSAPGRAEFRPPSPADSENPAVPALADTSFVPPSPAARSAGKSPAPRASCPTQDRRPEAERRPALCQTSRHRRTVYDSRGRRIDGRPRDTSLELDGLQTKICTRPCVVMMSHRGVVRENGQVLEMFS